MNIWEWITPRYKYRESAFQQIKTELEKEEIENAVMNRRHEEVVSGSFVYYVIENDTNIRHSKDGSPIMYSYRDAADFDCDWLHERVISIAEYNRVFGGLNDE